MRLEVLHVTDCPNLAPMLDRLAEATALPVATREVTTDVEAAELGMNGSPTLLVNGVDPFVSPDQCGGVSCRLYRDGDGRIVPAPSVDQLRDAIAVARSASERTDIEPIEVLSAWRGSAVPLDSVEKAVHQEILRTFASTGRPPAPSDLGATIAESGRLTSEVLSALHEADAIGLDADGDIAVAYPFSARATRHRVRIADRVDVFAMCAIDALGISAMLGQDTLIESLDVTSGEPIRVTVTSEGATWEPNLAVVFVGAATGGGPSSDCCCDYLNFFTDHAGAQAWIAAHPHVPGQILDQTEAVALGIRLFQPLLAVDPSAPATVSDVDR